VGGRLRPTIRFNGLLAIPADHTERFQNGPYLFFDEGVILWISVQGNHIALLVFPRKDQVHEWMTAVDTSGSISDGIR
jgi:hypothetical protein